MSTRAVYDCMLFFAHATRPERTRETFQLVDQKRVKLCLSREILEEIRDVLTRDEYSAKFPALTSNAVAALLIHIISGATVMDDVPHVYTLERDPKDSKYIDLAIAADAPFLVTRDNDLLDLMDPSSSVGADFKRRFPNLRIIAPREFVIEMQNSEKYSG